MIDRLHYENDILYMESVNLMKLAEEYSTPLYVYSKNQLLDNYKAYDSAFSDVPKMLCYALKANSNSKILSMLSSQGSGADVVSGAELRLALESNISADKIIFSGVGKSTEEITYAIKQKICFINIESSRELDEVGRISADLGIEARISFRVNPDIDPKTHPKISTGLKKNKFGIGWERAKSLYKKAALMKNVKAVAVHLHIGSQITEIDPFILAIKAAVKFADELLNEGIELEYLDIGGGLGIAYEDIEVPRPSDFAEEIKKYMLGRKEVLIMEPGRSLVGNAGILLTRINFIKDNGDKNFVIIDAGLNDLVRPAMYDSYHKIIPVKRTPDSIKADIVGPICESGDYMALDREISGAEMGGVLAICDAGAYGYSMASNYNMRFRPAEVLVDSENYDLIRRRETYEDIIRTEL